MTIATTPADRVQSKAKTMRCIESDPSDPCRGAVEPRWPGYGERLFPRCLKHGDARERREQENIHRNGPDELHGPRGFSPWNAGESW